MMWECLTVVVMLLQIYCFGMCHHQTELEVRFVLWLITVIIISKVYF